VRSTIRFEIKRKAERAQAKEAQCDADIKNMDLYGTGLK